MSTPADELRAAAKLLREDAHRAEVLSPLPWVTTDEHVIRCGNEERGIVADRSSEPHEAGDLPYIAAMHPGVGAALADWLDNTGAALAVSTHPDWQDCVAADALAVARLINAQP